MSPLDMVIYLADLVEPTRDFPGVERARAAQYEDLDEAMVIALTMSMEEVRSRGAEPHPRSLEALQWFKNNLK